MQNMNPNPNTQHLTAFLAHLRAKGFKPQVCGPWGVPTAPATVQTVSEAFSEPCACVTVRWGRNEAATLHIVSDDYGETFTPEVVTWTGLFDLLGVDA